MYWLITDETNIDPNQGDFFIYGGLIMTPRQMRKAHLAISDIRTKYEFKDTDKFKFNTQSRPRHIPQQQWVAAKQEAIEAALDLEIIMIAYVVLHQIAQSQNSETNLKWALNSVLAHFDLRFLYDVGSMGAVCIDRVEGHSAYGHLKKMFQEGVEISQDGKTRKKKLERIIHYSMSTDGASHHSSLVDIALGGLRYCINSAGGTGRAEIAQQILPSLAKMMWHKVEADGKDYIGGNGFIQYPKQIKVQAYQDKYDDLVRTLGEWSKAGT